MRASPQPLDIHRTLSNPNDQKSPSPLSHRPSLGPPRRRTVPTQQQRRCKISSRPRQKWPRSSLQNASTLAPRAKRPSRTPSGHSKPALVSYRGAQKVPIHRDGHVARTENSENSENLKNVCHFFADEFTRQHGFDRRNRQLSESRWP